MSMSLFGAFLRLRDGFGVSRTAPSLVEEIMRKSEARAASIASESIPTAPPPPSTTPPPDSNSQASSLRRDEERAAPRSSAFSSISAATPESKCITAIYGKGTSDTGKAIVTVASIVTVAALVFAVLLIATHFNADLKGSIGNFITKNPGLVGGITTIVATFSALAIVYGRTLKKDKTPEPINPQETESHCVLVKSVTFISGKNASKTGKFLVALGILATLTALFFAALLIAAHFNATLNSSGLNDLLTKSPGLVCGATTAAGILGTAAIGYGRTLKLPPSPPIGNNSHYDEELARRPL